MSATALRVLSNVCLVSGFASILAAVLVWFQSKEPDVAHGERFGVFVGLWAPTFFILSDRFDRYATSRRVAAWIAAVSRSPDTDSGTFPYPPPHTPLSASPRRAAILQGR